MTDATLTDDQIAILHALGAISARTQGLGLEQIENDETLNRGIPLGLDMPSLIDASQIGGFEAAVAFGTMVGPWVHFVDHGQLDEYNGRRIQLTEEGCDAWFEHCYPKPPLPDRPSDSDIARAMLDGMAANCKDHSYETIDTAYVELCRIYSILDTRGNRGETQDRHDAKAVHAVIDLVRWHLARAKKAEA